MRISTRGRYALRLLVDIALHSEGELVSLRDVAERQNISMKYLEQIVSTLNRADILESQRGPCGGYRLRADAQSLTVADILRVAEGPLLPAPCLTAEDACLRAAACPTREVWQGLHNAVAGYLSGITLATLVERARHLSRQHGGCAPASIPV